MDVVYAIEKCRKLPGDSRYNLNKSSVVQLFSEQNAILVIHGGLAETALGVETPLDPARIECMRKVLTHVGEKLASEQIDCLEAVTIAVEMLEDEPLFNAGKGSVIAANEMITMDASMRGARIRQLAQ